MFAIQFLRRCYAKRLYLLPVLAALDVVTGIYAGWEAHPWVRHLFVFFDPVNGMANILFWLLLFLPVAADVIQEGGTFGVSLFCRISKIRYMRKKCLAMLLYIASFVALSVGVSLVTAGISGIRSDALDRTLAVTGMFAQTAKLYFILVILGFDLLQLACCVGWMTRSSYAMMAVYAGLVALAQMPGVQERVSLAGAVGNFPVSILALAAGGVILSLLTCRVMKGRDSVGLKKGVSI